jgi:glycosyltransferase involved in cell wall biosynthesis
MTRMPAEGSPVLARYTALIRTRDSIATIRRVLDGLEGQSLPPHAFVCVDDGSSDGTTEAFPHGAIIHPYQGEDFSFAAAINQGLAHVGTELVLIVSSHTWLLNSGALAYAARLLQHERSVAAVSFEPSDVGRLDHYLVDRSNFDGHNGLSNTCALVRMELLRERLFRVDVFSAEDQEWASWVYRERGLKTARVRGAGVVVQNRPPGRGWENKRLNEEVCIAYFAKRDLMSARRLGSLAWSIVSPRGGFAPRERRFRLRLLWRLVLCHVRKPRGRSRYVNERGRLF